MFITEKMPEEAKDTLPFGVSTHSDGTKPTLWKWAIDKESDAYMVLVNAQGGGYDGTPIIKYFMLSWQGNLIPVTASPSGHTFNELGTTVHWTINQITLPDPLKGQIAEVIFLIRDAFRAIGEFFDGERYFAVEIKLAFPQDSLGLYTPCENDQLSAGHPK